MRITNKTLTIATSVVCSQIWLASGISHSGLLAGAFLGLAIVLAGKVWLDRKFDVGP